MQSFNTYDERSADDIAEEIGLEASSQKSGSGQTGETTRVVPVVLVSQKGYSVIFLS
jgi:hypothetical protein